METKFNIELRNVSYKYPEEKRDTIKDISFGLKKGEILGILGPNGCGKTTLVNLIAGFLKPTNGEITYNKENSDSLGIVFQEYSLLDWKNVIKNIDLNLISKVRDLEQRRIIVNNTIRFLNIEKYEYKLPKHLSGGTKQRVALARALTNDPNLLLIDEPFSGVDIHSKYRLMAEIYQLVKDKNKSALFVTHSIDEALFLSDKILIINQEGSIHKIVNLPSNGKRNLKTLDGPNFLIRKKQLQNELNKLSNRMS